MVEHYSGFKKIVGEIFRYFPRHVLEGYNMTCIRMAPSSEETINPGAVLAAPDECVPDVGVALPALPEVDAVGVLRRSGQLGATRTEP